MADQEQGSNQGRDQKQGTQTPGQDWNNRNRTDAESTSGTQRSGSTDPVYIRDQDRQCRIVHLSGTMKGMTLPWWRDRDFRSSSGC